MEPDPSWYSVKHFKEEGFERKRCVVGGEWFWTLDHSRTTCGEAPCVPYTFLDKSYTKSSLTLTQSRKLFIDYFAKRGHTPIEPRSVAARWRDDLYLTIASIVLFQPYVTSGETPPPANPLVVSQPCIRLSDIDNVGLTAGRHTTIFEMGGHHAFNNPGKTIYWKDETVRYCLDFYGSELGIKPEDITLKESVWIGGGNAGPCFEVAVGGLEIATLVFMEYSVDASGTWHPLPLKIVDTGYGMERMTWLAARTPTAFHAIYGDLVKSFADKLGVEIPSADVLHDVAKYSAIMNLEGDQSIANLREKVSSSVGIPAAQLTKILSPAEAVFGILDHTKTLSFMLSDGIVPSNSGEGYLARLVLRRALRLKKRLPNPVPLEELVSEQLKLWGKDFPRLGRMVGTVLEEVVLEEQRFEESQVKARSVLGSMLTKWSGSKPPSTEDLIELYDSKGIDPYTVAEFAETRGFNIRIPDNFFTLVSERHAYARKPEPKGKSLDQVLLEQPPTKKLYYEEPSRLEFNAKVLAASGDKVVLDETCFYPEGGGQPADQGTLKMGDKSFSVVDAQLLRGVVVHFLDRPVDDLVKPGVAVTGYVDPERRLRHTQHHDATHILLASIRTILGPHIWQAGAQKGFSHSRLDVTHFKKLSQEEFVAIEDLANRVVQENRKISVSYVPRTQAETKFGDTIYQGGAVPGATLRLVTIEGFDVEACGGTHSELTGSVGIIKILKVDQIQDGVTRFVFAAGKAALDHARSDEAILSGISKTLNSDREGVVTRLQELVEREKRREQVLERLQSDLTTLLLEKAEVVRSSRGSIRILDLVDYPYLNPSTVVARCADSVDGIVIAFSNNRIALASPKHGPDISGFITKLKQRLGGRGGGGKVFGEVVLPAEFRQSFDDSVKLLKEVFDGD